MVVVAELPWHWLPTVMVNPCGQVPVGGPPPPGGLVGALNAFQEGNGVIFLKDRGEPPKLGLFRMAGRQHKSGEREITDQPLGHRVTTPLLLLGRQA